MRLRLLLPALIAPALLTAATLGPATAATTVDGPVGSTANQDFADTAGDAPSAVDITNVHTYRTATDYRASVSFTALRPQRGNRWFVEFQSLSLPTLPTLKPASASSLPGGLPLPSLTSGNIVELRLTPGGALKSLPFKNMDGAVTPATCTGTHATADWSRSKITFVIPNNCWRGGDLPFSLVSAGARHYAPGTFDNTEVPPTTTDDKSDSLDNPLSLWFLTDGGLPIG